MERVAKCFIFIEKFRDLWGTRSQIAVPAGMEFCGGVQGAGDLETAGLQPRQEAQGLPVSTSERAVLSRAGFRGLENSVAFL